MRSRDLSSWIWRDALSMLEQAERLHRQFYRLAPAQARCWEPPVDVVETEDAVMIHAALPGVPASAVVVGIEPEGVTIAGVRPFPGPEAAWIHRLEIPYGRFERRIALPMGGLELAGRSLEDGCLVLAFRKIEESP